ncbi:MAG: SoxR reducing system RseC family protein [Pseudomonadota bacterium]
MILEVGLITAVEPEGLWVETIHRSTCGSCHAQKGCGQSLLAKHGASTSQLWVLLEGRNAQDYYVGDEVRIGIPEDVVATSALFIYMVPLIGMVLATILAHQQALNDGVSTLWAMGGLILGGGVARWHAYHTRFDNRLQPVLVGDLQILQLLEAT